MTPLVTAAFLGSVVTPAAAASESINQCSRHDSVRLGAGSSSVSILVQLCLCHRVSPTLVASDTTVPQFRPLCPEPPQPEAAQAQPNSKQHTVQTVDRNRMDMCRHGFTLLLGCTLKIKNQRSGNALKMWFQNPNCRNTCEKGKALLLPSCIYWIWTWTCIHLHTSGHLNGVEIEQRCHVKSPESAVYSPASCFTL